MSDKIGWSVNRDGYVINQAGTKVAQIGKGGTLYLYDKKMRTSLPFSIADWHSLSRQMGEDYSPSDNSSSKAESSSNK